MSLINSAYFKDDIHIPSSKYKLLQVYIDRYEPQIINDLFGYELGLLVNAYNVTTSPQRIKDIVEGKTFAPSAGVYTGAYKGSPGLIKWNGLINAEEISLIAYWVFYWYLREKESTLSNSGSGKSKKENQYSEGNNAKASFALYRMKILYGGDPQGSPFDPSCYNFMISAESEYPEWVFKYKGNINRFGT